MLEVDLVDPFDGVGEGYGNFFRGVRDVDFLVAAGGAEGGGERMSRRLSGW